MRQLDRQVSSQLYERLALSRNKASLLGKAAEPQPGELLTPEEAIRDPFVLEFLDMKDEYSESDQTVLLDEATFARELERTESNRSGAGAAREFAIRIRYEGSLVPRRKSPADPESNVIAVSS